MQNDINFKKRILKLNRIQSISGSCVIYIMSRDQRVEDNHALIAAAKHANALKQELKVIFILYPHVENRYYQHFLWMIEGLKQVQLGLNKLNIDFMVYQGGFLESLSNIEKVQNPSAIYFDFSPLKGPRNLKAKFANNSKTACYVVDTHNIVPVWITSPKEEYSAATLRPKVNRLLAEYLVEPETLRINSKSTLTEIKWGELINNLKQEKLINYDLVFLSGTNAAMLTLRDFLNNKFKDYYLNKNDPSLNQLSNLSPYLHFGQLASLRVALEVKQFVIENAESERIKDYQKSADVLLEELIIRKELADNFCYYSKDYKSIKGAKEWAQITLNNHILDKREYIYSLEDLENLNTHDNAWNAAQSEMMKTGKMHGYMRMYWAKKILEWTNNPEEAIKYTIYLNDKYSLDGYDPNGYTGIMWSIYGIHDRAWGERDIFGKIRYMNYGGLKRKFRIEKYISKWIN